MIRPTFRRIWSAPTRRAALDDVCRLAQSMALAVVFSSLTVAGWSQTAAFTYHGLLLDGGAPAHGTFDLQFRLYDDALSGTLIGTPVQALNVGVTNGLFTVSLDFGLAAFDGAERWLETDVRNPSVTNAFVALAPRQIVTSAPYAIRAATATSLAAPLSANGLAGTYSNAVTLNNPDNSFGGNGFGLTNLDGSEIRFSSESLQSAGATNVVWLAVRADGRDGAGTATDPRDASTAEKFDAIIGGSQPRTQFHLYPGIYETLGYDVAGARTNELKQWSSLIGSGMDATTIRLRADATASIGILYVLAGTITGDNPTGEMIHFENFTVDANGQNVNSNYTVQSVANRANNSRFVNIRSINNRGSGSAECFPLGNTGTNCLISQCIVTDCIAEGSLGTSAITVGPGGIIEKCHVDGAHRISTAYTLAEMAQIRANRATRVRAGAYADTHPFSGCLIDNNHFFNVERGVYINCVTGPFTNVVISANWITVNTTNNSFINVSSGGAQFSRGVTIRDNLLDWAGQPAPDPRAAFALSDTIDLKAMNNRVANSNMVGSHASFPNTNLQLQNNRTLDGRPIPGLLDNVGTPGLVFTSVSGTNVITNGGVITIRIP